jgi:hypothetical protein
MERKQAHQLLFQSLSGTVPDSAIEAMNAQIEQHLALAHDEKEAGAEALVARLATFTANALLGEKEP